MQASASVCWIRFRPGRVGGSVSVGLASCDCKSIPLLCNGCARLFVRLSMCVLERGRERERSGVQGFCHENKIKLSTVLLSVSLSFLLVGVVLFHSKTRYCLSHLDRVSMN